MNDLITSASLAAVPQSYAEKAMASLMTLHHELMDEKERRVDLYRKLMEREQALAELRMYVKVLEDRVHATPAPAAVVQPATATPPPAPPRVQTAAAVSATTEPAGARAKATPPRPPQVTSRTSAAGWKVW